MSRVDLPAVTALVGVQLLFGGFHVVAKALLGELEPLAVAALRVLGATPLLMLWAWRHDRVLPGRRELPHLALLGLLGIFTNQVLFMIGLSYTTANNAAILMPSIPVFAVAVAALLRVERIGPRRLQGIFLSAAGAVVMLDPRRFSLAEDTVFGNLLILINCLSFAAFLVLQRPVLHRLPWRTVIAWAFLFGGAGVLAVSATTLAAVPFGRLGGPVWWGLFYVVVLSTAGGYALNTLAVKRSSPALAAAFTNLQPVITAGLAFALLGEELGLRELLGFVLIASGLLRVSRRARVPPPTTG